MTKLASSLTCILALASATGCRTAELSSAGARVAASRNAAPPECKPLGYLTGRGGGTFGGDLISNDQLIEYALNDLRNQAADKGATFVQHDPPTLGHSEGTTSTVTITGTAYQCPNADTSRVETASK